MKLVIVRHGDPDYEHDSLTEQGWKEAEYLSDFLIGRPADEYYVSPLGRARDTASLTMRKLGKEAEVLDWLREFQGSVKRPDCPDQSSVCWDWRPADWATDNRFYSADQWLENETMKAGNVREKYEYVIDSFDQFLADHGYKRDGRIYRVENGNNDTIIFFCHFGVECVLLSRLLSISPMILWHGFCAAPTSVTTVVTEERQPGIACFRILRFGDVSHLSIHDTEPSFAARFCEKYGNQGERID